MRFVYFCLDLSTIKYFESYYTFNFYALLNDAFREIVRMLYTDTDSFFLYFFDENLAKVINSRSYLRDAFDFSEINNKRLIKVGRANTDLDAGEVSYFKDETKCNPIVVFIGLGPKMYLFTVFDASEPIPNVNYPINNT